MPSPQPPFSPLQTASNSEIQFLLSISICEKKINLPNSKKKHFIIQAKRNNEFIYLSNKKLFEI